MGGDNFDKSSKGEIIDFYEADRLFREYVESEYDTLIWDIHELIKRAASNGETKLEIVRQSHDKLIEKPESEIQPIDMQYEQPPMVRGFSFRISSIATVLGEMVFSARQFSTARAQMVAYFTKLGYDVSSSRGDNMVIHWSRVDRRKFP